MSNYLNISQNDLLLHDPKHDYHARREPMALNRVILRLCRHRQWQSTDKPGNQRIKETFMPD
jgi:hypothetical protein